MDAMAIVKAVQDRKGARRRFIELRGLGMLKVMN
jgi:hypothetical protein